MTIDFNKLYLRRLRKYAEDTDVQFALKNVESSKSARGLREANVVLSSKEQKVFSPSTDQYFLFWHWTRLQEKLLKDINHDIAVQWRTTQSLIMLWKHI